MGGAERTLFLTPPPIELKLPDPPSTHRIDLDLNPPTHRIEILSLGPPPPPPPNFFFNGAIIFFKGAITLPPPPLF